MNRRRIVIGVIIVIICAALLLIYRRTEMQHTSLPAAAQMGKPWPYQNAMREYDKALSLISAGKEDEGLRIVVEHVYDSIELVPEGTKIGIMDYYGGDVFYRVTQWDMLGRHLYRAIYGLGQQHAKLGDLRKATAIHSLGLLLGIQVTRPKPNNPLSFLAGYSIFVDSTRIEWPIFYTLYRLKDKENLYTLNESMRKLSLFSSKLYSLIFDLGPTWIGRMKMGSFMRQWDKAVGDELFSVLTRIFDKYRSSLQAP